MQVDGILASKGREVRTIQPDATIGEAIGRLCAERVGALVVSEDGRRIAGIISDRGITWAIAERGAGVVKERAPRPSSPASHSPASCTRRSNGRRS